MSADSSKKRQLDLPLPGIKFDHDDSPATLFFSTASALPEYVLTAVWEPVGAVGEREIVPFQPGNPETQLIVPSGWALDRTVYIHYTFTEPLSGQVFISPRLTINS